MSGARRRGLVRLGTLLFSLAALAIVLLNTGGGSGGSSTSPSGAADVAALGAPSGKLLASPSPERLPGPLHGEAMTSASDGLLVIGGADRNDVSTGSVLRLDPTTGKITPAGSLFQPLHDAAAVSLGPQSLVFGGGAAATVDTAQSLTPGGAAIVTGHLPAPASDLSALNAGGAAFVLGGYDGQRPLSSVLRTTDGRTFAGAGRLRDGVRYTATATLGGKIYAFGGELASGQDSSEVQEYDIATKRTVIAGRLPEPVAHAATVVLHGTIYVLGGRRSGVASDQILRFDPSTNTAVPAGRLPHAVFDGAAATAGDRGFLVGGVGSAGTTLDSIIVVR